MEDSLYTKLFDQLARHYSEDVAQEAIIATLQKGEAVRDFEDYAWVCARNFHIQGQRRWSTRLVHAEDTETGENLFLNQTMAPEQHVRIEAREIIESAPPCLVAHVANKERAGTPTEKSRWRRWRQKEKML